jgi:uncharacterized protein YndB with AHSA1/START domain
MTQSSESTQRIVFECEFDEPPEKVWRALTEQNLLEAWLLTDADEAERERSAPEYEIVAAEPHRLVRFACRDRKSESVGRGRDQEVVESTVTVEVSRSATGGTHLRLVHANFRITAAVACLRAA